MLGAGLFANIGPHVERFILEVVAMAARREMRDLSDVLEGSAQKAKLLESQIQSAQKTFLQWMRQAYIPTTIGDAMTFVMRQYRELKSYYMTLVDLQRELARGGGVSRDWARVTSEGFRDVVGRVEELRLRFYLTRQEARALIEAVAQTGIRDFSQIFPVMERLITYHKAWGVSLRDLSTLWRNMVLGLRASTDQIMSEFERMYTLFEQGGLLVQDQIRLVNELTNAYARFGISLEDVATVVASVNEAMRSSPIFNPQLAADVSRSLIRTVAEMGPRALTMLFGVLQQQPQAILQIFGGMEGVQRILSEMRQTTVTIEEAQEEFQRLLSQGPTGGLQQLFVYGLRTPGMAPRMIVESFRQVYEMLQEIVPPRFLGVALEQLARQGFPMLGRLTGPQLLRLATDPEFARRVEEALQTLERTRESGEDLVDRFRTTEDLIRETLRDSTDILRRIRLSMEMIYGLFLPTREGDAIRVRTAPGLARQIVGGIWHGVRWLGNRIPLPRPGVAEVEVRPEWRTPLTEFLERRPQVRTEVTNIVGAPTPAAQALLADALERALGSPDITARIEDQIRRGAERVEIPLVGREGRVIGTIHIRPVDVSALRDILRQVRERIPSSLLEQVRTEYERIQRGERPRPLTLSYEPAVAEIETLRQLLVGQLQRVQPQDETSRRLLEELREQRRGQELLRMMIEERREPAPARGERPQVTPPPTPRPAHPEAVTPRVTPPPVSVRTDALDRAIERLRQTEIPVRTEGLERSATAAAERLRRTEIPVRTEGLTQVVTALQHLRDLRVRVEGEDAAEEIRNAISRAQPPDVNVRVSGLENAVSRLERWRPPRVDLREQVEHRVAVETPDIERTLREVAQRPQVIERQTVTERVRVSQAPLTQPVQLRVDNITIALDEAGRQTLSGFVKDEVVSGILVTPEVQGLLG